MEMDLGEGIRKALAKITGSALIDEAAVKELVRELQRALISGDVSVKLVFELTKRIEERALREKPSPLYGPREHVVKVVYEELVNLVGEKFEPKLEKQKIMLLGLFGSGKTSLCAKLTKFYQGKGLKIGLIAADVHRPAAHEQLEQWAKQLNCGFYGRKGANAEQIVREALVALKDFDVLVLDTAGRSAFDAELAHELKTLNEVFKPDAKYLVLSADVGQVAGRQAEEFNRTVGITGVIITKMDGSGKGGGALSAVRASGAKVAFIGTGEKPDALEPFDARKYVARLCGFPDLQGLLEKAKEVGDDEALSKAMEEGKLDYNTFLSQMRSMRKLGPLKNILAMMGAYDLPEEMLGKSEEKLKQFEAAVQSMTPYERTHPEAMKNSKRQERVAKGAGMTEGEVREVVSSFEKAQKLMKGLRGNRGLLKKLSRGIPNLNALKALGG
ncbi:signal recognition particle protein [Candidatus Micrarchaeota archaeon]|nr:signal recognition particle protein [Candidatus Micrarchaeota archaeon]